MYLAVGKLRNFQRKILESIFTNFVLVEFSKELFSYSKLCIKFKNMYNWVKLGTLTWSSLASAYVSYYVLFT